MSSLYLDDDPNGRIVCELILTKTKFFDEEYIEKVTFNPFLSFENNQERYTTKKRANAGPLVFWNEVFKLEMGAPPNNLFFQAFNQQFSGDKFLGETNVISINQFPMGLSSIELFLSDEHKRKHTGKIYLQLVKKKVVV